MVRIYEYVPGPCLGFVEGGGGPKTQTVKERGCSKFSECGLQLRGDETHGDRAGPPTPLNTALVFTSLQWSNMYYQEYV